MVSGRVIQGFFADGARLARATGSPAVANAMQRRATTGANRGMPGPPTHAPGGGAAHSVQRHAAPGRPSPVFAAAAAAASSAAGAAGGGGHAIVQRFGGDGSFAVDPAQVGLVRSGGQRLPGPLLAKMEAALGADFSQVRVHVGPQASRIGALAFTTGNDLYFAHGQYQPDSVKGQQLIGHELAHVVQQREGRVSAPGGGVAVVQDRLLEAEADRLGMKAAAFRLPTKSMQRKPQSGRYAQPAQVHGHEGANAPRAVQRALATGGGGMGGGGGDFPNFGFKSSGMLEHGFQKRTTTKAWDKKRPGFWPQTENYIYHGRGSQRMTRGQYLWANVAERDELLYRCESCNRFLPVSSMMIDHAYPWESIVTDFLGGAPTQEYAAELYNNVHNLQLLCSSCNLNKSASVAVGTSYASMRSRVEGHINAMERQRQLEELAKQRVHIRFQ